MNTYQAIGAVAAPLFLVAGVVLAIVKSDDVAGAVMGSILSVFAAILAAMFWPLAVLIGAAAGVKLYLLRREAR